MWGIVLTNAAGDMIDQVIVDAPIDTMRDWCRRVLATRPDAVRARLVSEDGSLDYTYPER